jgi:hypothetical protein
MGKELANFGSKQVKTTTTMKEVLQSLINHCISNPNNEERQLLINDILDSIGTPPGRTKKSKLLGMKRYSEKIITKKSRCSNCGEAGHKAKTCTIDKELSE